MIYSLDIAGAVKSDISFDVHSRNGAFAGIIAWKGTKGFAKVYFNTTATRGSARKFPSIEAALDFIHARRISRGLTPA